MSEMKLGSQKDGVSDLGVVWAMKFYDSLTWKTKFRFCFRPLQNRGRAGQLKQISLRTSHALENSERICARVETKTKLSLYSIKSPCS